MPMLPTTKIKHKKTGQVRKMNTLDYAADIGRWKDWKIIYQHDGTATREEVADARREQKIENSRKRDPEREKKHGDKKRAQDERAVKTSAETAAPPPEGVKQEKVNENWKSLKWPARRQYVKDRTGTYPKSQKQAEQLMAK
jgi:hypothetical protein|tara:strand:- start:6609 stop:7031 length:423 start_codon:yes stop_codon:yes gene_type:complete